MRRILPAEVVRDRRAVGGVDGVGSRPGRVVRAVVATQDRTALASRRRCAAVDAERGGRDAARACGQQRSRDGRVEQGGGRARAVRWRFSAGRRRQWRGRVGRHERSIA